MRKQIDIPDDVKIELQVMAVRAGKDLKNYIQDLLIEHVETHKMLAKNSWIKE